MANEISNRNNAGSGLLPAMNESAHSEQAPADSKPKSDPSPEQPTPQNLPKHLGGDRSSQGTAASAKRFAGSNQPKSYRGYNFLFSITNPVFRDWLFDGVAASGKATIDPKGNLSIASRDFFEAIKGGSFNGAQLHDAQVMDLIATFRGSLITFNPNREVVVGLNPEKKAIDAGALNASIKFFEAAGIDRIHGTEGALGSVQNFIERNVLDTGTANEQFEAILRSFKTSDEMNDFESAIALSFQGQGRKLNEIISDEASGRFAARLLAIVETGKLGEKHYSTTAYSVGTGRDAGAGDLYWTLKELQKGATPPESPAQELTSTEQKAVNTVEELARKLTENSLAKLQNSRTQQILGLNSAQLAKASPLALGALSASMNAQNAFSVAMSEGRDNEKSQDWFMKLMIDEQVSDYVKEAFGAFVRQREQFCDKIRSDPQSVGLSDIEQLNGSMMNLLRQVDIFRQQERGARDSLVSRFEAGEQMAYSGLIATASIATGGAAGGIMLGILLGTGAGLVAGTGGRVIGDAVRNKKTTIYSVAKHIDASKEEAFTSALGFGVGAGIGKAGIALSNSVKAGATVARTGFAARASYQMQRGASAVLNHSVAGKAVNNMAIQITNTAIGAEESVFKSGGSILLSGAFGAAGGVVENALSGYALAEKLWDPTQEFLESVGESQLLNSKLDVETAIQALGGSFSEMGGSKGLRHGRNSAQQEAQAGGAKHVPVFKPLPSTLITESKSILQIPSAALAAGAALLVDQAASAATVAAQSFSESGSISGIAMLAGAALLGMAMRPAGSKPGNSGDPAADATGEPLQPEDLLIGPDAPHPDETREVEFRPSDEAISELSSWRFSLPSHLTGGLNVLRSPEISQTLAELEKLPAWEADIHEVREIRQLLEAKEKAGFEEASSDELRTANAEIERLRGTRFIKTWAVYSERMHAVYREADALIDSLTNFQIQHPETFNFDIAERRFSNPLVLRHMGSDFASLSATDALMFTASVSDARTAEALIAALGENDLNTLTVLPSERLPFFDDSAVQTFRINTPTGEFILEIRIGKVGEPAANPGTAIAPGPDPLDGPTGDLSPVSFAPPPLNRDALSVAPKTPSPSPEGTWAAYDQGPFASMAPEERLALLGEAKKVLNAAPGKPVSDAVAQFWGGPAIVEKLLAPGTDELTPEQIDLLERAAIRIGDLSVAAARTRERALARPVLSATERAAILRAAHPAATTASQNLGLTADQTDALLLRIGDAAKPEETALRLSQAINALESNGWSAKSAYAVLDKLTQGAPREHYPRLALLEKLASEMRENKTGLARQKSAIAAAVESPDPLGALYRQLAALQYPADVARRSPRPLSDEFADSAQRNRFDELVQKLGDAHPFIRRSLAVDIHNANARIPRAVLSNTGITPEQLITLLNGSSPRPTNFPMEVGSALEMGNTGSNQALAQALRQMAVSRSSPNFSLQMDLSALDLMEWMDRNPDGIGAHSYFNVKPSHIAQLIQYALEKGKLRVLAPPFAQTYSGFDPKILELLEQTLAARGVEFVRLSDRTHVPFEDALSADLDEQNDITREWADSFAAPYAPERYRVAREIEQETRDMFLNSPAYEHVGVVLGWIEAISGLPLPIVDAEVRALGILGSDSEGRVVLKEEAKSPTPVLESLKPVEPKEAKPKVTTTRQKIETVPAGLEIPELVTHLNQRRKEGKVVIITTADRKKAWVNAVAERRKELNVNRVAQVNQSDASARILDEIRTADFIVVTPEQLEGMKRNVKQAVEKDAALLVMDAAIPESLPIKAHTTLSTAASSATQSQTDRGEIAAQARSLAGTFNEAPRWASLVSCLQFAIDQNEPASLEGLSRLPLAAESGTKDGDAQATATKLALQAIDQGLYTSSLVAELYFQEAGKNKNPKALDAFNQNEPFRDAVRAQLAEPNSIQLRAKMNYVLNRGIDAIAAKDKKTLDAFMRANPQAKGPLVAPSTGRIIAAMTTALGIAGADQMLHAATSAFASSPFPIAAATAVLAGAVIAAKFGRETKPKGNPREAALNRLQAAGQSGLAVADADQDMIFEIAQRLSAESTITGEIPEAQRQSLEAYFDAIAKSDAPSDFSFLAAINDYAYSVDGKRKLIFAPEPNQKRYPSAETYTVTAFSPNAIELTDDKGAKSTYARPAHPLTAFKEGDRVAFLPANSQSKAAKPAPASASLKPSVSDAQIASTLNDATRLKRDGSVVVITASQKDRWNMAIASRNPRATQNKSRILDSNFRVISEAHWNKLNQNERDAVLHNVRVLVEDTDNPLPTLPVPHLLKPHAPARTAPKAVPRLSTPPASNTTPLLIGSVLAAGGATQFAHAGVTAILESGAPVLTGAAILVGAVIGGKFLQGMIKRIKDAFTSSPEASPMNVESLTEATAPLASPLDQNQIIQLISTNIEDPENSPPPSRLNPLDLLERLFEFGKRGAATDPGFPEAVRLLAEACEKNWLGSEADGILNAAGYDANGNRLTQTESAPLIAPTIPDLKQQLKIRFHTTPELTHPATPEIQAVLGTNGVQGDNGDGMVQGTGYKGFSSRRLKNKNEDSIGVLSDSNGKPKAFVVADGVGSSKGYVEAGMERFKDSTPADASSTLVAAALNWLQGSTEKDGSGLVASIKEAAARILQNHLGTSTTVIAAQHLPGNKLAIVQAGDSRLYVIRRNAEGNMSVAKVTEDHHVAVDLQKEGKLPPGELGRKMSPKNAITRSIGGPVYRDKEGNLVISQSIVDIHEPFQLYHGDYIIAGTDGIIGNVLEEELLRILESNPSAEYALDAIQDLAEAKEESAKAAADFILDPQNAANRKIVRRWDNINQERLVMDFVGNHPALVKNYEGRKMFVDSQRRVYEELSDGTLKLVEIIDRDNASLYVEQFQDESEMQTVMQLPTNLLEEMTEPAPAPIRTIMDMPIGLFDETVVMKTPLPMLTDADETVADPIFTEATRPLTDEVTETGPGRLSPAATVTLQIKFPEPINMRFLDLKPNVPVDLRQVWPDALPALKQVRLMLKEDGTLLLIDQRPDMQMPKADMDNAHIGNLSTWPVMVNGKAAGKITVLKPGDQITFAGSSFTVAKP